MPIGPPRRALSKQPLRGGQRDVELSPADRERQPLEPRASVPVARQLEGGTYRLDVAHRHRQVGVRVSQVAKNPFALIFSVEYRLKQTLSALDIAGTQSQLGRAHAGQRVAALDGAARRLDLFLVEIQSLEHRRGREPAVHRGNRLAGRRRDQRSAAQLGRDETQRIAAVRLDQAARRPELEVRAVVAVELAVADESPDTRRVEQQPAVELAERGCARKAHAILAKLAVEKPAHALRP